MSSARAKGIEGNIANMLTYYYKVLIEDGSIDPKRDMATILPNLIGLSEAQAKYVKDNIDKDVVMTILDNSISILEIMYAEDKVLSKVHDGLKRIKEILGGSSDANQQGNKESNGCDFSENK